MAGLMRACKNCGQYTLKPECKKCNMQTNAAHPSKYSKEDRYAIYRRKELFPQFFK
ncbi:MAG: nucleolar RNA-binding Nop10p family protein [Candidatus Micrarchaeota archaeon]